MSKEMVAMSLKKYMHYVMKYNLVFITILYQLINQDISSVILSFVTSGESSQAPPYLHGKPSVFSNISSNSSTFKCYFMFLMNSQFYVTHFILLIY